MEFLYFCLTTCCFWYSRVFNFPDYNFFVFQVIILPSVYSTAAFAVPWVGTFLCPAQAAMNMFLTNLKAAVIMLCAIDRTCSIMFPFKYTLYAKPQLFWFEFGTICVLCARDDQKLYLLTITKLRTDQVGTALQVKYTLRAEPSKLQEKLLFFSRKFGEVLSFFGLTLPKKNRREILWCFQKLDVFPELYLMVVEYDLYSPVYHHYSSFPSNIR